MKPHELIFKRTPALRETQTHYCSGCGHGIIGRLVAEVIDELELRERTIGICPVGCSVIQYNYWDFDCSEAAHGRAPAVATAIKRLHPDYFVFTYQGDGDLAAIGTTEIIHAAARGEHLSVIFVNNATYGMTGGQMAPTTLIGQVTATTPYGRSPRREGYPLKISELIAYLPGVKYVERTAVHTPQNIIKTKQAIRKAFKYQLNKKGFALIEVLAMCPTAWNMTPVQACKFIEDEMQAYYQIGKIKEIY